MTWPLGCHLYKTYHCISHPAHLGPISHHKQNYAKKREAATHNHWYKIFWRLSKAALALHWRHNDHDDVSNHQPHGCLLNRLFRRISKKTSKLRVTGLCVGNSPGPVNSPHKWPVTRKMFPFDDVIMAYLAAGIWQFFILYMNFSFEVKSWNWIYTDNISILRVTEVTIKVTGTHELIFIL